MKGPPHNTEKLLRPSTPPGQKKRGRKPGTPKTPGSGIKKGQKQKSTIIKEKLLADAHTRMFGHLTQEQLLALTPLDTFKMLNALALEVGQYGLAMAASGNAAPYRHARLAPKVVDEPDEDRDAVKIKGGFPVD